MWIRKVLIFFLIERWTQPLWNWGAASKINCLYRVQHSQNKSRYCTSMIMRVSVCVGVGTVRRLHAGCSLHQIVTALCRRHRYHVTMPQLWLSTNVVSGVHGSMVCQSAGSDSARNLAKLSMSLSNLPLSVLYARCLSRCVVTHTVRSCLNSVDLYNLRHCWPWNWCEL